MVDAAKNPTDAQKTTSTTKLPQTIWTGLGITRMLQTRGKPLRTTSTPMRSSGVRRSPEARVIITPMTMDVAIVARVLLFNSHVSYTHRGCPETYAQLFLGERFLRRRLIICSRTGPDGIPMTNSGNVDLRYAYPIAFQARQLRESTVSSLPRPAAREVAVFRL
jgi:hypothetical protein